MNSISHAHGDVKGNGFTMGNPVPWDIGAELSERFAVLPLKGKAPNTALAPYGHKNATKNPAIIAQWRKADARGNYGIAVEQNGLMIVAPDSEYWHERFKEYGLPETFTVQSGGGEGHYHYYYRCPSDWPQTQRCRPQDYDIKSVGYMVGPESVHPTTGKKYRLVRDVEPVDAPAWVLDFLQADDSETAPPDYDEPPVVLNEADRAWWTGGKKSTGDNGKEDRSATLFVLGNILARYNLSRTAIATALENRDRRLWREPKYYYREDREERYLEIADKAIANREDAPREEHECTDTGNGQRFAEQHRGNALHVYERNEWAVYDGSMWAMSHHGEVQRLGKETARGIYGEAQNAPNPIEAAKFGKWAIASSNIERFRAMLTMAASEPGMSASIGEFDANPLLLNCENVTLDLATVTAREQRPDDMQMKQIPVAYDLDATSPQWESFLAKILPSQAVRDFVRRAVGYSLTGITKEHALFILYGDGGNGKSTFVDTIAALLGEYAQAAQMATFAKKREAGGHSDDIAKMAGARFVSISETEEGMRFNEGIIKPLAAGDRFTASFKGEKNFDFTPQMKLWFAVNDLPEISDQSRGMWRRIVLIPFTVSIPTHEQDKDLKDKLRGELPGILNWCLAGLRDYHAHGLNPPQEVLEATKQYKENSDQLAQWVDDCCDVSDSAAVTSGTMLFRSYKAWCEMRGEKHLAERVWSPRMVRKGFTKGRNKAGITWQGIKLNGDDEPGEPGERTFAQVPYFG